jgi:hypothetical protein
MDLQKVDARVERACTHESRRPPDNRPHNPLTLKAHRDFHTDREILLARDYQFVNLIAAICDYALIQNDDVLAVDLRFLGTHRRIILSGLAGVGNPEKSL